VGRRVGRPAAPQEVDDAIAGQDRPRMEQQQHEQTTLLRPTFDRLAAQLEGPK
jgi:hypothetical protein